MELLNVEENILIRIINDEFQKTFPYLVIFFFTPEIWEAQKKRGKKGFISGSEKLANIKKKTIQTSKTISIDGNTEIGVLENSFMEQFGIIAQIGCSKKEGEFQYTNTRGDTRTLEELSKKVEKSGYIKNPKPDSYKLMDESENKEESTSKQQKVGYNYMRPLS
jgi:hypothetical protein